MIVLLKCRTYRFLPGHASAEIALTYCKMSKPETETYKAHLKIGTSSRVPFTALRANRDIAAARAGDMLAMRGAKRDACLVSADPSTLGSCPVGVPGGAR